MEETFTDGELTEEEQRQLKFGKNAVKTNFDEDGKHRKED